MNKNWKSKYITIWSGQTISLLTSSILQMSIVWYMTQKTSSAAVLSFATLIGYLPAAFLGLFIGSLIDRYNKKIVMVLADGFIALVGLVLFFVGLSGDIDIWVIFVVLLFRSFGTAFHYPALLATTPLIVPEEELTRFAGISQSLESVSMVVSPALAAILFGHFDLPLIIFLDVIGALIAMLALVIVKIPKNEVNHSKTNIFEESMDGLKELKRVKGMMSLMVIGALYAIVYFPIGTLYPFMSIEYFKATISESGIVETMFSIGTLLGAMFIGVYGNKIKKIPAIATSIGVYGIGVLISGLLPTTGLYTFIGLSLIMGIFVPFYTSIEIAIFQMKFKQEYLGRVFSLTNSVSTFTMPIGLLLSGIFVDIIGINTFFVIAGVFTIILSIITISLPSLRKL